MKYLKILVLLIVLSGCSKEEICTSNCGTIVNDGITGDCYWLEIENNCSYNKKKFCFDESTWLSSPVGSEFCVTNESEW